MASIISPKGKRFNVPASVVGDYLEQGFTVAGATSGPEAVGYDALKVPALAEIIAQRNEGREEADLIPTGKKAEMVAALQADDAREPAAEV